MRVRVSYVVQKVATVEVNDTYQSLAKGDYSRGLAQSLLRDLYSKIKDSGCDTYIKEVWTEDRKDCLFQD